MLRPSPGKGPKLATPPLPDRLAADLERLTDEVIEDYTWVHGFAYGGLGQGERVRRSSGHSDATGSLATCSCNPDKSHHCIPDKVRWAARKVRYATEQLEAAKKVLALAIEQADGKHKPSSSVFDGDRPKAITDSEKKEANRHRQERLAGKKSPFVGHRQSMGED